MMGVYKQLLCMPSIETFLNKSFLSLSHLSLSAARMAEEIKKFLFQLKLRIEELYGIIITDRDGVPIVKVVNYDKVPDTSTRPAFLSTFGMATEQASKMGIGRNKTLICMYPTYQVIHFSKLPLVVTLIASSTANTGSLLNLEPDLLKVVNELSTAVADNS